MALEKTEAIVLKSFLYGDTSKIARCYTRDYGKISIIAKGVRSGKTLRSGYLDPPNYLSLVFYHNPRRQLQMFSRAEFEAVWSSLKNDMKKLFYGFAVVELIDRAVTGQEPHGDLFQLMADTLQAINDTTGKINRLFWFYEIRVLSLLGFRPALSECPRCHRPLETGHFSLDYGELLCGRCEPQGVRPISSRALNILRTLKRGTPEEAKTILLKPGDRTEVGGFLKDYLTYHIEGVGEVRSLSVLEKLLV
ncbi:MAG: DNA repair protein RecO [Fidelibacterota bacterium]